MKEGDQTWTLWEEVGLLGHPLEKARAGGKGDLGRLRRRGVTLPRQKREKWLPRVNTGFQLHESVYAMVISGAKINSKLHSQMADLWASLVGRNHSFRVYI